MIYSCTGRPTRNPASCNSLGYQHLKVFIVPLILHSSQQIRIQLKTANKTFESPNEEKKNYSPEMTANLMLPCSSLAIRSASSISNVPKPYMKKGAHLTSAFCSMKQRRSEIKTKKKRHRPDVGIWLDRAHAQALQFHTHAARVRCYTLLLLV